MGILTETEKTHVRLLAHDGYSPWYILSDLDSSGKSWKSILEEKEFMNIYSLGRHDHMEHIKVRWRDCIKTPKDWKEYVKMFPESVRDAEEISADDVEDKTIGGF